MDNVSQEEIGELLENQEGQEENLRKISLSWYVWKLDGGLRSRGSIIVLAMRGQNGHMHIYPLRLHVNDHMHFKNAVIEM